MLDEHRNRPRCRHVADLQIAQQRCVCKVLHFWHECYTSAMPTLRPRHMITESDRIAEALEAAAILWPDLGADRGLLLRKILETGADAIDQQVMARNENRRLAVAKSAGSLDGVWPANWRDELRDEWPA